VSGTRSQPARVTAAILPIALACLLVTVRGVLDRSDLALLMVLGIVAVATSGDRIAAAIGATIAAASFDFFLTRPYGSLRVDSAPDIETTLILLLIGLAVGQISIVGRERRRDARRAQEELGRLEHVAARLATDAGVTPLVLLVAGEIAEVLSLVECRFERERPALPELFPNGQVQSSTFVFTGEGFELPRAGLALAVVGGGATVGWFRLVPRRTVAVSLESRKVAIALAQLLGSALARPGPGAVRA
jgi:Domain of unknown function (DUF4118)